MNLNWTISLSIFILLFIQRIESQALQSYEFAEVHMGTLFRIVSYAESQTVAETASQRAFQRIEELNNIFSDYVATSELSLISEHAYEKAIPVSNDMWTLLQIADRLYHQSNKAFNVAMGPLTKLWRRAIRRQEMPNKSKLAEALKNSNWNDVLLDEKRKTIRLKRKGMRLDMGAIAKGYAVDQAYQTLVDEGLPISLVDGGGDIYAGDAPPEKEAWTIMVESNANQEAEQVTLKNKALASSGSTFKFIENGNKRYSHIINPITGYGITNPKTINVKAASCVIADALATTFSLDLNPEMVNRITSTYQVTLL